jgi:hypothetical protein
MDSRSHSGPIILYSIVVIFGLFVAYSAVRAADHDDQPANLSHVNGANRIACRTEEAYNKSISFAVERDETALRQLLNDGACFSLTDGEPVFLEGRKGLGTVKIRRHGMNETIWTIREAID